MATLALHRRKTATFVDELT